VTDRPSLLGVQDATLDAFTLLVPAVGIATAWIAGGGHPTVGELAGSAVVLLGLGLTTGVDRLATSLAAPRSRSGRAVIGFVRRAQDYRSAKTQIRSHPNPLPLARTA